MSDPTLGEILNIVSRLGFGGMLIVILYGGYKRWWVFGWTYQEKVEECEKWETLALRGVRTLESTTETITPVVAKATRT